MGKLNFHGYLISQFYPTREIHKNLMHAKNMCFTVFGGIVIGHFADEKWYERVTGLRSCIKWELDSTKRINLLRPDVFLISAIKLGVHYNGRGVLRG